MRKHGVAAFQIETIATALSTDQVFGLESEVIAQHDSFRRGYNMTEGGEGPRGLVHTQSSREKMRRSQTGKTQSAETIAKRVVSLRGRKLPPRSEEHRAKISTANTGRRWTDEQRAVITEKLKARQFSPEHRAKISAAKKGKAPSPEQGRAHSEKMKGRKKPPRTDEHRARLSAARAAAWARAKADA